MYGTCETLCRLLGELYPAETPLNLIIWSPADIKRWPTEWNMPFRAGHKGGTGAYGRHSGGTTA